MTDVEYEKLREKAIHNFKLVPKDTIVFDLCEIPKDIRVKLLEDPYYVSKTKSSRAQSFIEQIETLDNVIAGVYNNSEKPSDTSGTVLKALEMKQRLLFEDLNVTKDETNALNVTFIAMSKEDFDAKETVEIHKGSATVDLGADFGVNEDTDSFEARLKADVNQKLKEKEENKTVL